MPAKPAGAGSLASLPFFESSQKFMLAAMSAQAQACKSVMRYQVEMLNFAKHRIEQDMRFVDDLVASQELNDAFDVVSDFMQNAATEYTRESGKIASIGSKLASETAQRVRKQASESIEEMATKTVA